MGKIEIKVFVASLVGANREIVENLRDEANRSNLDVAIEVINVLEMPEKALALDVFATPAIVREVPTPILQLIGKLASAKEVFTIVETSNGEAPRTIVV